MSDCTVITSARNPKVKALADLWESSRTRRERGLFAVEGKREVLRCATGGYSIDTLYFCTEITSEAERAEIVARCNGVSDIILLDGYAYSKAAVRGSTEGVMATVRAKTLSLSDIKLEDAPLILVAESVEKPGNLGALLRTADAAGADAVIICDPLTDLYNPNLIRASLGAAFTVPTVATTSEDAIFWLKSHSIRIYTAQLQDSEWYYDTDMKCGTAIVLGSEADGLTDIWRKAADAHIRIPMLGVVDSLNVSASAAILAYEAVRQRQCK